MQLGKTKPISWFTEIFSKSYFKTHIFSATFIYAIFIIILIALINEVKYFTFLSFSKYILKVIFSIVIVYLLKLFFEKYKI